MEEIYSSPRYKEEQPQKIDLGKQNIDGNGKCILKIAKFSDSVVMDGDGERQEMNEENIEDNGDLAPDAGPVDDPDVDPAIEIAEGLSDISVPLNNSALL